MKTLYLDMDGVVADFNNWSMSVLGVKESKHSWPEEEWEKLRHYPRMYRDLEKTPEADGLVNFCRSLSKDKNFNLLFLTGVPKANDIHWAFYDKVIWAYNRYPDIPVHFGPYSKDKQKHCLVGDILIDDRQSNITEWIAAGGIGILHQGNLHDTIKKLNEIQ
jgi:sulfur relay (sulfurtransferase) DsrC/TusE family protein